MSTSDQNSTETGFKKRPGGGVRWGGERGNEGGVREGRYSGSWISHTDAAGPLELLKAGLTAWFLILLFLCINVILFSSYSRALPTRWKHDSQQLPNFIFYGLCPQRKTASVFWVLKSKKPRETLRSLSWVSFHSWTTCCRSVAARVPEAGRDGDNLLEEQLDKEVVSLLFFYPKFWLRC